MCLDTEVSGWLTRRYSWLFKIAPHVCGLSGVVPSSADGEDDASDGASAGGEDVVPDGGEDDVSPGEEDVVPDDGDDEGSAGGEGDFSFGVTASRGGRSGMSWSIQPTTWRPAFPKA